MTWRSPSQRPPVFAYKAIAAGFPSSVSTFDEGRRRSLPPEPIDDTDLIQEQFWAVLVRMEDLCSRQEPCRVTIDVSDDEMMANVA